MITGKTKKIGILGWPVEHSLSPAMHNAAFAAAGLDYVYVPLPVRPADLEQAVAGLKALGFAGANVTIPHKVAVMRYLDDLDHSAEVVGAVNTIVFRGAKMIGYNTDAGGFIESLCAAGINVNGRRVVVLGAGGAARAVVGGLIAAGVSAVAVGVRQGTKAREFIRLFPDAACVRGYDWQEAAFQAELGRCELLVNGTPLGMSPQIQQEPPLDWQALHPGAAVCDLIYNPAITRFLATAARRGHMTFNGEGMLIGQGALAFALWTGREPSREVLRQAFALG